MKTVTASAVSRTLKTKFTRSTSGSTIVRGYHYFSGGYQVIQSGNYAVVRYQMSSSRRSGMIDINEIMESYSAFLTAKGFRVTPTEWWGRPAILVSKEN
jgi:hypothetical protein